MITPAPEGFSNVSPTAWAPEPHGPAPGRLPVGRPIGIIDIGSNSVRLVVYEGLSRAPTPIFNEKVMCGLGKKVASTGRLGDEAVEKAIAAVARFRLLCRMMNVGTVRVLATAAARDASNGALFIARATEAAGVPIDVISGQREAQLAAQGVIAGFHRPDGVVGDLGGGSLELTSLHGNRIAGGVSLQIGGLALMDRAEGSLPKAQRIVRASFEGVRQIEAMNDRVFYAVGGTWRALAKLHMRQRGYPLDVMHGYTLSARDASDFARIVERADAEALAAIEAVSQARRPLLAYGALVLEELIRRGKPRHVVISALGVREGLLHEMLPEDTRRLDPLLVAARDLNVLRSRSPRHGEDLIVWTDRFFTSAGFDETVDERRLRHAACLLADIGWRAHPDYRGEQSFNIIANAAFVGVDHPGRAFLAMSVFYRHVGLADELLASSIRELPSARLTDRARILGAAMRVAYLISASMPDVLPRIPLRCEHGKLVLELPPDLAALGNERVQNRLRQLARLVGREPRIGTIRKAS